MSQVIYNDEVTTESGSKHIGSVSFKSGDSIVATVYSIGDEGNWHDV